MPTANSGGSTLLPAASIGGAFYKDPDHDAGDVLDALFGDAPDAENEDASQEAANEEEFDDTEEMTPPARTVKPKPAPAPADDDDDDEEEEGAEDRFTALEARLAASEARSQQLADALLSKEMAEEAAATETPEEDLTEPTAPDEETLRLFQMGDPEATTKFTQWVKDVAYYQAARGLDARLPNRVEKTLNTLSGNQQKLASRVEAWWATNGTKVAAIKGGVPFQKSLDALEKSGKLSPKYIEAQMDRVLEHVEEQAKLYGAEGNAPAGGPKTKPKTPRGPMAHGFKPTSGGASRRTSGNGIDTSKEAMNSVDALLGMSAMTTFHM